MKRTLPVVVMGLGLLLLLGSGWLLLNRPGTQPAEVPLPARMADLPLTQKTGGEAAMGEFEDLHGKQFPITSGSIGIYGESQITVWAARTDSPSIASQMVNTMRDKIARGNSPFIPLEQLPDGGRTVYVLEGMGQKHYYFQSKNLVIWLAVDPALADQSVQQALEVYP